MMLYILYLMISLTSMTSLAFVPHLQAVPHQLFSLQATMNQRCESPIKVQLPKPLGIVLEEIDDHKLYGSDQEGGVCIVQVDPHGNAAKQSRLDGATGIHQGAGDLLCIRDKIESVNGLDVSQASFESVMDKII